VQDVAVAYLMASGYARLHRDFGYKVVDWSNKKTLAKALLHSRSVVVGGGGIWGLDANANVFLLSCILWFSRYVLRKRVFLLGVGFYGSTGKLGRLSGLIAGHAASLIIARDEETARNFRVVSRRVNVDRDIAFLIPTLNLAPYKPQAAAIKSMLGVHGRVVLVCLRWVKGHTGKTFEAVIRELVESNTSVHFIVMNLVPGYIAPGDLSRLKHDFGQYANVEVSDYNFNPLAFYLFLGSNRSKIVLVAPQYHAILSAYLNGVPYFPISYDNKVTELLASIGNREPALLKGEYSAQLQKYISTHLELDT
jgi:polysaccharide pyruvyl transferase WcaK-like protein